jgi:multiple sugar transport system substrate-binding protein
MVAGRRVAGGRTEPLSAVLAERAINRRDFLRISGAGLVGVGLLGVAACGGGGTSGTLRWSMWSDTPEETKVWKGLAEAVHKKYPDITVKLETVTFADYWDKLTTQIASENEADIVGMQSLRMPGYAARGALQPLKPFIDDDSGFDVDDFFGAIRQGLSVDSELYALGYDIGPIILYYNKDLFDKAGVGPPPAETPMSWEEFREKAEQLTDPGTKEYGFVEQPVFDFMVPWLWSGGGDYMNTAQTVCTLDTPESIAAMEFVIGMITDNIAAPVTDLANPSFAVEEFYGGKIGMHVDGPWQFINIRENSDFEWDVAPMPAGPAGSVTWAAGSGFGISNTTENADAAWTALKTITSTASLEKLVKAGRGYPARESAVSTFEKPPPQNVDVVQKILLSDIGETRPFVTTTTWQETTVMLTRDFSPVFLGKQSVEAVVGKVKPQFDKLLKEHQEILEQQS